MAVHDHTARAHLSFSASGDMFTVTFAADSPARRSTAQSLRLSTLDDVALALYSLAVLCIEDERCRTAQVRHLLSEPTLWPLPPLIQEGLGLAIQCLEQYAGQLGGQRGMGT